MRDVAFRWTSGPDLLRISDFRLERGERVFLRGASGSGKSTLLGLATGVLTPQSGRIHVLGEDLTAMSGTARDRLRAREFGVIFQMFNLLPYLSVVRNVTLGCDFSSERRARVDGDLSDEALRLLGRLGLTDPALLRRPVRSLSVGQQQRVAVARALIGAPRIVIADEPTSALDADARDRFIELLVEEASRTGASLLFVSHDASLGRHFDRAIDLSEINTATHAETTA